MVKLTLYFKVLGTFYMTMGMANTLKFQLSFDCIYLNAILIVIYICKRLFINNVTTEEGKVRVKQLKVTSVFLLGKG